jgi:phosphosulfolactate synthase
VSTGLRLRVRRLGAVLAREGRRALGLERTVYVDQRLDEYRGYWRAAAERIGAEFVPLSPALWEVRMGGRRTRISGYVVQADDPVTLRLAGDKALCLRMAADAGIPVPAHHVFTLGTLDEARRRVREDAGPWVVKPVRGSSSGLGVTTGITTAGEVESAAVRASLHGPDLLLERMVPGESCRLLYLDGELVHAARRRGVRVTGDGRTNVRELARAAGLRPLLPDPLVHHTVAAQGTSFNAVPEAGREVLLRGVPLVAEPRRELRTVYDETITPLVHPATAAALAEVVRAVDSRFAGVDVVTADPSRPLAETGGAFIESNTTPGIHHHYHTDDERRTHPVAVRVLRRLLEADAPPSIPIRPGSLTMSIPAEAPPAGHLHTADYLQAIGVRKLAPALSPFDPGYDPATVESHLEQSHHLMSLLKISMACWLVADERATRRKIAAARKWNVPVVTGGGPFEVAVQQGALDAYLDLCADLGVTRIECGEGFTDMPLDPLDVVRMIHARGMEAQFEMGKKHGGAFTSDVVDGLIAQGRRWLDAGALQLVVEARESARGVGLFDDDGAFNPDYADRFAGAFGLDTLIFEAPNKPSQFALLEHFGTRVHLCNVRLEEVLRVEIYRRGLHSDAFASPRLRPAVPVPGVVRFAGIRAG